MPEPKREYDDIVTDPQFIGDDVDPEAVLPDELRDRDIRADVPSDGL